MEVTKSRISDILTKFDSTAKCIDSVSDISDTRLSPMDRWRYMYMYYVTPSIRCDVFSCCKLQHPVKDSIQSEACLVSNKLTLQ